MRNIVTLSLTMLLATSASAVMAADEVASSPVPAIPVAPVVEKAAPTPGATQSQTK